MILRALAVCLLTALPAAAQDFRGLRPGMQVSALGPIGEPMLVEEENGLTLAVFPLPFEQALIAFYGEDAALLGLSTQSMQNSLHSPNLPDVEGLQFDGMTFAEVERALGLPRSELEEQAGVAFARSDPSRLMRVWFDAPDGAPYLVVLEFGSYAGFPTMPALDADLDIRRLELTRVHLIARAFLQSEFIQAAYGDYRPGMDETLTVFPLPIDEAFPSLIP